MQFAESCVCGIADQCGQIYHKYSKNTDTLSMKDRSERK